MEVIMDTKKNAVTGPMTEKQYNFIKVLYKELKEDLTADQDKNLITKMQLHRDGKAVQSKEWASATIEKLLKIRTNNALARVK
jgi:spermidine/putrescine-binding protein